MPADSALCPEVRAETGAILADLSAAGWSVTASRYDAPVFGNWFVDLERDGRAIRLMKDRSQFMVDGPTDEIRAAGLFKAFEDMGIFREAVVVWTTAS